MRGLAEWPIVPRTLRTRTTLLGTAGILALLVIGSATLVSTLDARLTDAADRVARSRVQDLLDSAHAGTLSSTLRNVDDNGMAQVVAADGRVLAATPNLGDAPAVAAPEDADQLVVRSMQAPDDRETETYRVWSASTDSAQGRRTVFVGTTRESVAEATAELRATLAVGVPLATVVVALVLWLLLGRTLGRLERIRRQVDDLDPEDICARVVADPGGRSDEVGRLTSTMNALLERLDTAALLERLDTAARRQRDLVADISHDLLTPLSTQRIALELALVNSGTPDRAILRRDVLGATEEMERLVGDLLVLASLDANLTGIPVLVDLDEVVLEEARRASLGTAIVLDTSGVSAAPTYADADDVRRIVRNLVANAVDHATSRVTLTARAEGEDVVAVVEDDGPGIPPAQRDTIFERFHRADPARSNPGHGLGLPIARGLAERNAGSVDLLPGPGGARFRVVLPSQDARPREGEQTSFRVG
jgi:signal transduction histidine kinase